MREIEPISLETAQALVDFGGGAMSDALAEDQMSGAVAIHNILAGEGFAYLADEVGMGKTYVALGVVALIRFFHPDFRVLYVTPRENIQKKWLKELANFTKNNWKWTDERVRGFQNTSCVEVAYCRNLADWARQSVRDSGRDFITRMTSFSFPLPEDSDKWRSKRDELLKIAFMLDRSSLDLRGKAAFKASYGKAINTLLPHYDLVIVDEAHNLKHGRESQSTRNRLLTEILGLSEGDSLAVNGLYGRRFDRVLLLSATPLESDYSELWRQLDLFGFGGAVTELCDPDSDEARKKETASRFLVRRLTGLDIGGQTHTKNMYRREWRAGGCHEHDQDLEIPDERQRLIVALVQKKVAEILNDDRFGASFQIGMLASFESFFRTAKVKKGDEDEGNFDDLNQTDEQHEKEGVDTSAINQITKSYRQEFGEYLPHPKMDAVVENLAPTLEIGDKTLVFVRRVKSVDELAEKLSRKYDAWLKDTLKKKLPESLHLELERVWKRYENDRRQPERRAPAAPEGAPPLEINNKDRLLIEPEDSEDPGGNDTFFAWFFRGAGPKGLLSGAAFRKNRLQGTGSAYSTFFEDNYLADLLGNPPNVHEALAKELHLSTTECSGKLRALAHASFPIKAGPKKYPRLPVFRAYQAAGLTLTARSTSRLASQASVIRRECFPGYAEKARSIVHAAFPGPKDFIETRTFFTELRRRETLHRVLWPALEGTDFREKLRDRECRRELLAATARLGHAFIDLWALMVGRIGSMSLGAQERTGERAEALISDYLDLLVAQSREPGFHAFKELSEVAKNFELILQVNFPEVSRKSINELPRLFGRALSAQDPVGRMSGGVNATLVRQFRMPGYPIVLITTEVLQEGEDLHTFCSRIIHYGITWTPSAMEQRTGRIDRIGSLTHRVLDGQAAPHPNELMQVYYPYLGDTVERLQVERVLERMNQFIRMIHKTAKEKAADSQIDTRHELLRERRDIAQITGRLKSAFPVLNEHLEGMGQPIERPESLFEETKEHLKLMKRELENRARVDWDDLDEEGTLSGTVFVEGSRLLVAEDKRILGDDGIRRQPFIFFLRSAPGCPSSLLHCTSPVGIPHHEINCAEIVLLQSVIEAKLCMVPAKEAGNYTLSAEGDILFSPEVTQLEEVLDLLGSVAVAADRAERELLGEDAPHAKFREDLRAEAHHAAD